MANTLINKTENDIELKITHEDIIERTALMNKLHNFKGFQKNRDGKQELLGLRKGEKNTRKE